MYFASNYIIQEDMPMSTFVADLKMGYEPDPDVVLQIKLCSILQIIRGGFPANSMIPCRLFDAKSALCFI